MKSHLLFRCARKVALLISCAVWLMWSGPAQAQIEPSSAVVFLDFEQDHPEMKLHHGTKIIDGRFGKALEFTTALQFAELPFPSTLEGATAVTIGGWFFPRRTGEQSFLFRGLPDIGPTGERFFRPQKEWVNFLLGADDRGFLLGTINGNGNMPFPYVTVNQVAFDSWSQLVVVKTARGAHSFYVNGALVHTSRESKPLQFVESAPGEPLRLAMPHGGLIAEAWVLSREVSGEEVQRDFSAKRERYHPAHPGKPVLLREMNAHPAAGLWPEPVTAQSWPAMRKQLEQEAQQILGAPPAERAPLDPQVLSEEDCGGYLRRKISIQVQPGDRMPAYLLIPKNLTGRVPAVICFYGTTSGAGKETTVGLSGLSPGTPPERNAAFAIDMVEAGFVALAADYLRDGERIKPGRRPYDTTEFYEQFRDWSIHGKDAWDTSRAIDYLQTLDFIDPERIGMTGHSYGGHSTIFTAAMEPRIKVAVANGPVSDFLHHGLHWAVPKGAGNSQSMPALRPYVLDHTKPLPITFQGFTALIAPRPLLVGQAAGERRPMEEENHAAVREVYGALGHVGRVRYHWYAGDHDFPPEARAAAVEWFRKWFAPAGANAE